MTILGTRLSYLEGEKFRGTLHFHNIQVTEKQQPEVVQGIVEGLKPGWYCHLVQNGKMLVMFRGKRFQVTRGNAKSAEQARQYGIEQGILTEQMAFEHLIIHLTNGRASLLRLYLRLIRSIQLGTTHSSDRFTRSITQITPRAAHASSAK